MQRTQRLRGSGETALTVVMDVIFLVIAFELAISIRLYVLPTFYSGFPGTLSSASPFTHWWIFLVWLFFFTYEGLYTSKFAFWDEVFVAGKASFFAAVGIFTVVSLGKLSAEVSRTVLALMGIIAIVAVPFARVWMKALLRERGLFRRRVLVLGAGKTGRLMLNALRKESNLGYEVVGFLDDDPVKAGTRIDGVKVHRGVDKAPRYLKRAGISDVVITMPGAERERLQSLINSLQHEAQRLMFVPDVFGMAVLGTELRHFFEEQAFALELKNNLARPLNYYTKRVFDFIAALFLMIVLAIPLMVLAAMVRMTSSGPAFFGHQRVGRRGKKFKCYKFRTMYADAQERLNQILDKNPEARHQWEVQRKLDPDPRITPVGAFLRRTSLDELPQLINVLLGQMSLVGPRPVTEEEIQIHYRDMAELCFSVMPGITGLWQVSGRSQTSYDYRIALDAWYVRNWNLWLDVMILLKTIRTVFKAEGAR